MWHLHATFDCVSFQVSIYNSPVARDIRIFYENAGADFRRTKPARFLKFIASCNDANMAFEYAKAFKEHSLHTIMQGGLFHGRTLHGIGYEIPARLLGIRNMRFAERAERRCTNDPDFHALAQEKSIDSAFLKPLHGNVGAVDAVVIRPTGAGGAIADLYQLTTSLTPDIDSTQLNALMECIEQFVYPGGAMVPQYTMRLFFVLPDFKFEQFRRQDYGDSLTAARRERLEQLVLAIPTQNDSKIFR
jgi:hypothetical protein